MKFTFFGTSDFSLMVLNQLELGGYVPSLIVCGEDAFLGRKRVLTHPVVKTWGLERGIKVLQPSKVNEIKSELIGDFFILASYGKILSRSVLAIPKYGVLNVHPSLLPKHRGASPLQAAILNDDSTGVSIIRLDEQMDHGPILMKLPLPNCLCSEWPPYIDDLERATAEQGGKMLCELIPKLEGFDSVAQDDSKATYCGKIKKEDGLLNLNDSPELNVRKIRAYRGAYFILNGKRIIVEKAHCNDGKLVIDQVVPEGKKRMSFEDFKRGNPAAKLI